MRTKLLTSFIVVSSFWWVVSFILWSSGPYSSNLGALKDISALLEGWVNLKSPVDVANTNLLDSWAVQWFVLMYWTGPVLFLTAVSTGIGSFRVWKHAAEFKKERDIREAAETTAYRGVGCTKGKLPRIGVAVHEIHAVEVDGFSAEINGLISEILSTIHEGYSNGSIFKGDEVDGDWMEYIEEKCQYVLEISREKELAMVAALGVEIGKITAYTSKKGAPGKPLKFSKGGMHKTLHAEGAKQIAKLDAWWKLSPDMRVATVSVLRYLEQPEFMPDGLFKDSALKERVLTAIEDVYDIKPVSQGEVETTSPIQQGAATEAESSSIKAQVKKTENAPSGSAKPNQEPSQSSATKSANATATKTSIEAGAGGSESVSSYTPEQEAQVRESLEARFKSMQEQDGLVSTKSSAAPLVETPIDDIFGFSDASGTSSEQQTSARGNDGMAASGASSTPPWEEDEPVSNERVKEVAPSDAERKLESKGEKQHSSSDANREQTQPPGNDKPVVEQQQKKKRVVVDNTPAAGSFVMTPGAEYMLEPSGIDRHLDKAMMDLWPIMSFHSPNQPKGAQAFGWKQGKRIYLIEIKFREAVAKRIPSEVMESLTPTTYNEKLNALSRELIAYFIRKGLLVNKIENVVLSAKEPLWKIQAGLYEFNGVFALDVTQEIMDMLPVHNSKFQLSVVGCLWSHTIVSGRFPRRDAEGKIIEDSSDQKNDHKMEKRQRESKPAPQQNKSAYKDPTQMDSLPMDLLAPNSGKFKKDNPAESGPVQPAVQTKHMQKDGGIEGSNTADKRNEGVASNKHAQRNGNSTSEADTGNQPKGLKPTGLDLLSLVTSGGAKPDRKPATKTGNTVHSQNQPGPSKNPEYSNTSKPSEKTVQQKPSATPLSQGTNEEGVREDKNPPQNHTEQSSTKPDESGKHVQPVELEGSVAEVVGQQVAHAVEIRPEGEKPQIASVQISEEKEENFSISLTDIVAKAGALETHVPELSDDESSEGGSDLGGTGVDSVQQGLDVDSLLDDFSNDLAKTSMVPKGEDKP